MVTKSTAAGRSVHITGAAWSTALGSGLEEVWCRLVSGTTGMVEVASEVPLRNSLAAVLPERHAAADETERQLAVAHQTALAALDMAALRADDVLLVVGTSLGSHLDVPPPDSLHAWSVELAQRLGTGRTPVVISTACSSGSDAMTTAATLIRSGFADRCLVGGVDLLTAGKRQGHAALSTMTPTLPRSFDEHRDGMLLGEGAGFLVLEAEASAALRNAPCLGLLRSWGAANDAAGLTAPDTSGGSAATAMHQALAKAGLKPEDIAVVSTHGTATRQNDQAEAAGLTKVWAHANRRPVAFATKGSLGHTLGATGILEAITLLLALRHGEAPPVPYVTEVMDGFPLPLPVGSPVPVTGTRGMSLTLGFGGFSTCLLLETANPAGGAVRGEGFMTDSPWEGLDSLATGVAELDKCSRFPRSGPFRFADLAAWTVLHSVESARTKAAETIGAEVSGADVGVIVVSEQATLETLRLCSADAAAGRISPQRFVAASPGTLVGVTCTRSGFTGPGLLLTMPADDGRTVAAELAREWLEGPAPRVGHVVVIVHKRSQNGRHHAECVWLRRSARTTRGEA
jgi:3-oxoacyl-[acyl-carrier-protein] synthase II